jgi:hypothetical protein
MVKPIPEGLEDRIVPYLMIDGATVNLAVAPRRVLGPPSLQSGGGGPSKARFGGGKALCRERVEGAGFLPPLPRRFASRHLPRLRQGRTQRQSPFQGGRQRSAATMQGDWKHRQHPPEGRTEEGVSRRCP